jgi:hypothetical protein
VAAAAVAVVPVVAAVPPSPDLLAAPADLRAQVTVIKWKPAESSHETLRNGTNQVEAIEATA